jgi:hypothetical protein
MKKSDIPDKFPIPFAANAGPAFIRPIPVESQIGLNPGAASLNDGYVPLNMQPIPAGGIPPYGQDQNGILFQSTSWDRWLSVGGPVYYDFDFATQSGGYPAEAIIRSRIVVGNMWMSTIDDNTSDPDAFGAGWITPPNMIGTGFIRGNPFPNDIPAGWVPMRAGFTLGSASSSATYASADAIFLYVKTWLEFSNAICPVVGGRGANPYADFAANKPIQIYDGSGAGMVGNDSGTGRLAGVPVIFGNANTTGSQIGENLHSLTLAENGPHNHTGSTEMESVPHTHTGSGTTGSMNRSNPHDHSAYLPAYGLAFFSLDDAPGLIRDGNTTTVIVNPIDINHEHAYSFTTSTQSANHIHPFSTSSSGSGTAHNTVSRSMVVNWLQKL